MDLFYLNKTMEIININREMVRQMVVPILGDGNAFSGHYLFWCTATKKYILSYAKGLVSYIVEHWIEFSIMSHEINGDNYAITDQ